MIVVDASAVAEVILRSPKAVLVEKLIYEFDETLHAPHFVDLEVTSVIRRKAAAGEIGLRRALQALDDLSDFELSRYSHVHLLGTIWSLRHNFSVYDAAYVVLAEMLGARLLTFDLRMATAVRSHTGVQLV